MMWSIFSCACWPLVYLQRSVEVYSSPLPVFKIGLFLVVLIESYRYSSHILDTILLLHLYILVFWTFFNLFIGGGGGEREREKEKEISVRVSLIYAFIGWFLHVPWLGIKRTTLGHWDDVLTKWATWPGLFVFLKLC